MILTGRAREGRDDEFNSVLHARKGGLRVGGSRVRYRTDRHGVEEDEQIYGRQLDFQ